MLHISMVGFERAIAKLHGIDVGLVDLRIPLKQIQKHLEKRFKKTFKKGGDPKWKSITKTTLKLREVNKSKQPLIDRGNLMRALTSPRSRYAKHKVFKRKLRFGISDTLKYAGAMEDGVDIEDGWGREIPISVPARPFMHLVKEDREAVDRIMNNYMEGLVLAT